MVVQGVELVHFNPPALTTWMFSRAVCPQLEYLNVWFWGSCSSLATWFQKCGYWSVAYIWKVALIKSADASGCFPAQTLYRRRQPPPNPHFVEGNQEKGKNCKIRQEFCLWGARTQLRVGAGDGSRCRKAKLRAAGPRVAVARWLSLLKHVYRLMDLKPLSLTTGAPTVLVTHTHTATHLHIALATLLLSGLCLRRL